MVSPSSIPHQYYLGDFPGTLQYSKEKTDILQIDRLPEDEDTCGYVFCEHSLENLNRVTPPTEWKIILMMRREKEDGEVWLKAALLNKDTDKIALLTSCNDPNIIKKRNNRAIRSVEGTWAVGHYRMSAPIVFWRELQNRLLYSI